MSDEKKSDIDIENITTPPLIRQTNTRPDNITILNNSDYDNDSDTEVEIEIEEKKETRGRKSMQFEESLIDEVKEMLSNGVKIKAICQQKNLSYYLVKKIRHL